MTKVDYLSITLKEQRKKALLSERKKHIALVAFYVLSSIIQFHDGAVFLENGLTGNGLMLLTFGVSALGILLAYEKTKSQKLINIATLILGLSCSLYRFLIGASGFLGIVEIVVSIVWVFIFLDLPYACALNYTLLAARSLILLGIVHIEGTFPYDRQIIALYIGSTMAACLTAHWFAYKIQQITNYRDRSLQLALAYCDELDKANQAKGLFLSNMSHDIRTPMNAIAGYTAVAQAHQDDAGMVADCLEKIRISEKHLEEIVNDVLNMSRLEAGKENVIENTVRIDQICHNIEIIIAPQAKEKSIELVKHIRAIEHDTVKTDETKLRRILLNIVSNAVKYTGENGRVECTLSETPGQKNRYSFYTFQIRDNGIGMSSAYLEHVFEPFSREDTLTSTQTSGTGLGMAIVKKYVDLLGGTVNVESEQGKGTTVTVTLELPWSGEAACKADEAQGKEFLAGKRVLYVDDSVLNREIAAMMMIDLGMQVTTATNGKDAVDALTSCKDGTYDYVLMDIRMPVMNGIEATKKIRSQGRAYLKQIPIIAVTANVFVEDEQACMEAGMSGYMTKPFTVNDMIKTFYEYAERTKP